MEELHIVQLVNKFEPEVDGLEHLDCGQIDPYVAAREVIHDEEESIILVSSRILNTGHRMEDGWCRTVHFYDCVGFLWYVICRAYVDIPHAILARIAAMCGGGPATLSKKGEHRLELVQAYTPAVSSAPILNGADADGSPIVTVCTRAGDIFWKLLRSGDPVHTPIVIADSQTIPDDLIQRLEEDMEDEFRYTWGLDVARVDAGGVQWVVLQATDDDEDMRGFPNEFLEDLRHIIENACK